MYIIERKFVQRKKLENKKGGKEKKKRKGEEESKEKKGKTDKFYSIQYQE